MITIDRWFVKHAFRPILILVLGLYILFLSSVLLSYLNQKADNELFINHSAKQLLLALNQKNRSQVDVVISTIARLETVKAVSLCDGDQVIISRRSNSDFCSKSTRFSHDIPIVGSESYFLRVQFKNIFLSMGVLLGGVVMLIGALAIFLILLHFKKKFEVDLLSKLKNIGTSENDFFIKEISEISKSIVESQENKTRLHSQKKLTDLAAQVSHDIRSPLAVLNHVVDSQKNLSEEDKKLLRKSLCRINEVADDLLKENRGVRGDDSFEFHEKVNLSSIVSEVIEEKRLELKKYELISIDLINSIGMDARCTLSKKTIRRVISNLINNSVEAMAHKGIIKVSLYQNLNKLFIEIIDQGGGLSDQVIKNLGHENLTTKPHGNGLGLMHAIRAVERLGGSINFENFNNGLKVYMSFNVENESIVDAILVDNDELCRMMWEAKAKSRGMKILTFSSPMAFTECKNKIRSSTPIYLDSQLDEGIKGEVVAAELFAEGFTNLYMTTGHPPEIFSKHSFLSGVISKSPPF